MSGFYEGLQKTADKLLGKYGRAVKIIRENEGAYNPATGAVASSTKVFSGFAAVLQYKSRDVDGTNILSSDVKIIVQNLSDEIQAGDIVEVAQGEQYTVVSPAKTSPAGINIMTTIQARVGASSVIRG